MNWLNILEKNNKDFEKSIKKEIIEIPVKPIVNNTINADEEFDIIYSSIMSDIKINFEDYIKNNALPFLNNINKLNGKYDIRDFLKYNSVNYEKIFEDVNNENQELAEKNDESDEDYIDIVE